MFNLHDIYFIRYEYLLNKKYFQGRLVDRHFILFFEFFLYKAIVQDLISHFNIKWLCDFLINVAGGLGLIPVSKKRTVDSRNSCCKF